MEYPVVRIQANDMTYFNTVDDVVGRSIAAGDPLIALEYIQGLQRDWLIKGLATAKLLYRMKQAWDLFRAAGIDDDFENVVEATTGYKPATVNKYINMWDSIFENDDLTEEIKTQLAGKPIETLLLLTAAAREGSLDQSDWDHIAQSSDIKDVRSRIREKRGEQTSSRMAKLPSLFYRDTGGRVRGTLIITVDGDQKVVGFLNMDTGDDDVDQYIQKMINSLHIFEVF
jgi:hypothetical protein